MIKHVCFLDNLMKCVDAVLWRDSRAGSSQACVMTVRRDNCGRNAVAVKTAFHCRLVKWSAQQQEIF